MEGILRPGKLILTTKWKREARTTQEEGGMFAAAGQRVAEKSYGLREEGVWRAAWRLGMPDWPVFPATLANYDCRRFDRPQTLKARSKSIAINLNFNLNKCTIQKRETKHSLICH